MKLTKHQHFIALLIMLPSIPFALPLSLLVFATRWAHITAERIYDWVGWPFLEARHRWIIRCERVNSIPTNTDHSALQAAKSKE